MVKKKMVLNSRKERKGKLWKRMKRAKIMMLLCMVTPFFLLTPFSFDKLFKKSLMSWNCIKK